MTLAARPQALLLALCTPLLRVSAQQLSQSSLHQRSKPTVEFGGDGCCPGSTRKEAKSEPALHGQGTRTKNIAFALPLPGQENWRNRD